jgi:glutamine synthetase
MGRKEVVIKIGKTTPKIEKSVERLIDIFACRVFNQEVMEKMLPKNVCENILNAKNGYDQIKLEYADIIANALREWATSLGATHYTHWFHPMTGMIAQKHDSFLEYKKEGEITEKFSGKQLLQGEPDASSFPSGGLRSTYEARGYTIWDPTSSPFIWESEGGLTLCIPSLFFSWRGDVLDNKIPVLRSDNEINEAVLRLFNITKTKGSRVFSTLGIEQEYFIVDRRLRNLRPDLVILDKTVYGAPPPKGQELEDHYFGSVKKRVFAFMRDFEQAALCLGIPVKTRHNEVAPAQHEITPSHERSSISIDHNILLMELMKQIAIKHDLACILHEKPFSYVNGSGKHNNWSLITDSGVNLLDPTSNPEKSLNFLVIMSAVLHAVHEHSVLLRASVGSVGNDYRLGGSEAPPAIISVYLGEALEELFNSIESQTEYRGYLENKLDFSLPNIPQIPRDNTDRNRTSFLAFTGDKFEFRAVGSSSNCSFPLTVMNAIVAESLNKIIDEIEERTKEQENNSDESIEKTALFVIRKYLLKSRNIRFSGDNYSMEWSEEAKKRKLPNIKNSFDSFYILKEEKTKKAFSFILSSEELDSRYEILCKSYAKNLNIEVNLMIELFQTEILPAAFKHQKNMAKAISLLKEADATFESEQIQYLRSFTSKISKAIHIIGELKEIKSKADDLTQEAKAKVYCDLVLPKMEKTRQIVDELEPLIDDDLWTLPKYRELLFLI